MNGVNECTGADVGSVEGNGSASSCATDADALTGVLSVRGM